MLIDAADRDASEHERCRELLLEWRSGPTPWHLTWGIVYEFLRVTTHGPRAAPTLVAAGRVAVPRGGVREIYTRDADFHRFPGIEVRDPS